MPKLKQAIGYHALSCAHALGEEMTPRHMDAVTDFLKPESRRLCETFERACARQMCQIR